MPASKRTNPRAVRSRSKGARAGARLQAERDARLEEARRRWEEKVRPLMEAAHSSEQLSEADFAIRINARG
jgi:hypothetical protein